MTTNKNILVTGGAGYIGAHVCKALSQVDFNPVSFDNLISGHRRFVKWGPLEIGDVTDKHRLTEVVRNYRPVGVMHFAAYAYVGESIEKPDRYYYNNVVGSLNLLSVMKREGVDKIVFSSSCATYGLPKSIPINEEHPQVPINPYGSTKLIVETILRDFDLAYGLKSVALRYFNAAGIDCDGEIGEDHAPETHAIPLAIAAAFGNRTHFEIYGTDYPTEDGTAVRDYIHVTDLASAHVLALQYLLEGGERIALNLGTGEGHSVREIVAAVERQTGRLVPIKEGPRRPGDPPILVADPGKAQAVLGWRASWVELDTIVNSAVNWYRRNMPR